MTRPLDSMPELGALLARAASGSSDAVVVLTPEGVVRWANAAAGEAFAGRGELAGQSLVELVEVLSVDVLREGLERAASGEAVRLVLRRVGPARALEGSLALAGAGGLVLVARPAPDAEEVGRTLEELNRRYRDKVRELASLTGRLREAAVTDPLTNLFNRRAFRDRAELEWERAREAGSPLGLVALDLDHFKAINDRHGHAVGDEVLRHFAVILRSTVRATDVPARVGGEEFVALLPQTDLKGALLLAERVRARLAEQPPLVPPVGEVRLTVSAGVGSREGYRTLGELLVAADAALYRAKADGRDCVRLVDRARDAA